MATALLLTFTAVGWTSESNQSVIGISSQTLTFVDVKPAERALAQIQEEHNRLGNVIVQGVILKDVVI